MRHVLQDRLKRLRNWKQVVWDAPCDRKLPLKTKFHYAIKGFSAEEYFWYDFSKNDYKEYISDYERLNSREINGNYKFLLDDKLVFEEIYGQYVNVPRNYAWINYGFVYGLHDNGMNNENYLEYLKKYQKTVLKWNGRGGGAGTFVIEHKDGKFFVNEEEKEVGFIKKLFAMKGSAILCEYINQSSFAAGLYSHTTNTIRIVCAKEKGQRDAEFIAATQRIGVEDSIPVDNFSSGGLIAPINPETGELGVCMAKCGRVDRVRVPFEKHPDTGEQITGKVIPNWNSIVRQVVDLTNKLPYLNFVAWDILLTDDGFTVIEGNASSGNGMFQMQSGKRKSKIGDIYRSYGIIKD